jgi:hypothetical protein
MDCGVAVRACLLLMPCVMGSVAWLPGGWQLSEGAQPRDRQTLSNRDDDAMLDRDVLGMKMGCQKWLGIALACSEAA